MEQKHESTRKAQSRSSNSHKAERVELGTKGAIAEEEDSSSSCQLMEVSRGAHKLNQTDSQRELDSKKIFSQQRPVFEIDVPKVRKSHHVNKKKDPERRTLKEILETMHFKGLLRSNSMIKEIKYEYHHQSSDFFSEQSLINDNPPIVLIKPRHVPSLQPEEKSSPVFQEEGSSCTETKMKKMKVKEEPSSNIIDSKNRGLNLNAKSGRAEAEENPTPIKRLSQQEVAKDSQEKETITVKKEVKTKQKVSIKMKSLSSVTLPSPKKEANDRKGDKTAKPAISSKKPVEKEVAKAMNLSRCKDQAKVTPPKLTKPENASNVSKNKVSSPRSATANSKSNGTPQTANSKSNHTPRTIVGSASNQKKSPTKKKKPVSKAIATKKTTEKLECKGGDKKIEVASENDNKLECIGDNKKIDLAPENDNLFGGYSNETADQLPTEEGTEHTDNQIEEHHDKGESSAFDVTPVTIEDQSNRESIGEVDDDPIIPNGADSESFIVETGLKALLLSNPAFLNHAEDLFDLNVNVPTTSQKFGICDITDANSQLLLDCANEIVRRRSLPDSQMVHPPLLALVGNAKSHSISLAHLLKETCDSIEALRRYSELAGENYAIDSLYAMLERDINCSEVLSSIWELGWRKGFSVDDKMQVVDDIEKQLLTGLIEEICA
ncbi:hypothetical protein COLO4_34842 [Corchorus olitorius]|uniref:DUF4378 domain-containing protein n=1 Tax=Corchorus olitorius TaxID=93759 RepID=A0A1R3GJ84_9ROSI|nr:hypothetical protein COLO4_34842 [Corchorus olitorius]